jgi:glucose/mannose-6-phosphate isomerase
MYSHGCELEVSTSPLDDIAEIQKIDKSGMLSFCVEAPKHYREAAKIAKEFPEDRLVMSYRLESWAPVNIIIAGMGGSAIGGELLKDWTRDKATMPIDVSRAYSLPNYADEKSLVFIVSYSGETEESLSAFLDGVKRKCRIFCISSGGSLLEFAEKLNVPYLRVPSGMPPRAALPYLFVPILMSLEKLNLILGVSTSLDEATTILHEVSGENSPEKPTENNFSKTLASKIGETVPVVYGFGIYRGVAQRFKQQFNENCKIPSKWEFFTELNHNEIVGWEESGKLAENFSTIFIRDKSEPSEIRSRIETTQTLMLSASSNMFEVWSQGKSALAKMLSTILIGDFTSVYLAILRKVDPTPVRTIALLKDRMKETGTKEKIIRELTKIAAG